MSKNHDTDETLLPDDAEQKISELLAAIQESENQANGVAAEPPAEEPAAESTVAGDDYPDEIEPFDTDGEDFVDLDAAMLDNSSDVLQLDEHDSLEEQLMEEHQQEEQEHHEQEVIEESLDAMLEPEKEVVVEEHEPLDFDTTIADRFKEQENLFAEPQPTQQVAQPPVYESSGISVWLTPLLAGLALLVSAFALWSSLSSSESGSTLAQGDGASLSELKVELATLGERMAEVEQRAEAGDEVVQLLDKMQATIVRMEQRLLGLDRTGEVVPPVMTPLAAEKNAIAPTPIAVEEPTVASMPQSDAQEEPVESITPTDEEVAASLAVEDDAATPGKVLVQGWSVNLGSYYRKRDAERLTNSYQDAGIDAEIREIPKGKATWYRVRVMGFASKKEANTFINALTPEQGRDTAWPSYYKGYVDG